MAKILSRKMKASKNVTTSKKDTTKQMNYHGAITVGQKNKHRSEKTHEP
jgi:hypothetical protein